MILAVGETAAKQLVTVRDAIGLVEAGFLSLDRGESALFPATFGHGSDRGTRFGAKAGFDGLNQTPGLKVGSYWPGNRAKGLGNHGSTTLLLDDATGRPRALVAATHLTALRTAAADAVGVKHLARADASVLALIGPGHQAYWDALAIAEVRRLSVVRVAGRDAAAAEALAMRLREAGLPAESAEIEAAVAGADIVATVTASRGALFPAEIVRPGTHISAMGADGVGKQELDPALAPRARLFADLPPQSVVMGEFQYLADEALVHPIGGVIAGRIAGREAPEDITIFDSSGVALQDLVIAAFALERAEAQGLAVAVDLD